MGDPAAARGFLGAGLDGLTAPDAMADRVGAADRIARAIRAHERITVFGDYDVDGTTSAAVIGGVIEQLGGEATVLTASRFEGGYGLGDEALARVLDTRPTLLVTCDCGSSDHPRIARAAALGIDTIVVDHHLVPTEPLPAFAFLNPHRPACGFPYKNLCSAGLTLSLGAAVRRALDVPLDLRPWLDLVALGTIADVVPLDGDNRRLVRAGLARLTSPQARPGVQALREAAGVRAGASLGAIDVSFRLTPRLNAPGRLGDSTLTLALLRSRELGEARGLAARIEEVNNERRRVERRVTDAALEQAQAVYGDEPAGGVVLAAEGWHRGVVGITAARVVDRLGVPCVVVAIEGAHGHGSCRVPDAGDAYAALTACAAHLDRFGGHRGAAGVTLRAEAVDAFRQAFFDATRSPAAASASPDASERVADVALDGVEFAVPPASDLLRLEPLGEGNPEPVFVVPEARVDREATAGEDHLKLDLRVGASRLSAFGPRMAKRAPGRGRTIAAIGALRPDTWRGRDAVELRIDDLQVLD
jgi:single-stranded-DNA-specific exonuclease